MEQINSVIWHTVQYVAGIGGSVIGIIALIYILMRLSRLFWHWKMLQEHRQGVLLQILLPKHPHTSDAPNEHVSQAKTKSNVAEQMFSELHALTLTGIKKYFFYKQSLSFEIVATAESVKFYCFCPRVLTSFIQNAINASYPEAEITIVPNYQIPPQTHLVSGIVRVKGPDYSPIRTYENLVTDSLNSLLNKVSHLRPNEMVVVQTLVTPVSGTWRKHAYSFLNYLKGQLTSPRQNMFDQIGGNVQSNVTGKEAPTHESSVKIVDEEMYREVEHKMGRPGFRVLIRVLSASLDALHAQANFENLTRSYSMFDEPPLTTFVTSQSWIAKYNLLNNFFLRMPPLWELPLTRQQFIANTAELASLFHFPGEEVEVPRIEWLRAKRAPAPTEVSPSGTFLGYNAYRGATARVFISREDRRRHFYIVGQTGTGKSEYLKHLVLQDIQAGEGVCFIDPHGDAAEDIIAKIPPARIADTIYWNPADTANPMGLNIMESESEDQKHILINSFIALLYKLYDPNRTGIMGPMLERAIRNVMLTAMEEPGATLIEVLRLLTSPEYAESKIPLIKDPIVKTYWTEELARTSDFHKSETLGYFISKFDRFVTDVTMRNIIGQGKSSFNFREIMDKKKILIVNLSKGRLGEENSNFLGLLLIPKFLVAAMSRINLNEADRPDFYLYVDEFQNFATPDFAEIMSEARKYRLCLTVANQYIAQIQEQVRNAVFGNVGTIGAFRVGVDDAKYLVSQFTPVFNEYDLTNNAIGNLYLRLLINGKPSIPFSVALEWKEVSGIRKDLRVAELVIRISQIKYAMPRIVVEQDIIQRAHLY